MTFDTRRFKTKPFNHQLQWLDKTVEKRSWGAHWEQGTGKSKFLIDTAAALYRAKEITGLLVLAPNGVHRNWMTDELPKHLPQDVASRAVVHAWSSKKAGTRAHTEGVTRLFDAKVGLPILCMSYDGFKTERGKKAAKHLLTSRTCLMITDEAHTIKSPGADVTKQCILAAKLAPYRRTATGTPITSGPFNAYSQLKFLQNDFWMRHGIGTYAAFKSEFGVFVKQRTATGQQYDQCVAYKNLDALSEMMAEITNRVLKKDVLDLPPKLYSKRRFNMSDEQWRRYNDLKKHYVITHADTEVEADLPIVRMMRMQQIACGYLPGPVDEFGHGGLVPIPGPNPRLKAMEEIMDETGDTPTIVWARFTQDIEYLMKLFGDKAVRYDGTNDEDDDDYARSAFQAGEKQWFVANERRSSGITLTRAKQVVYYSNLPDLIHRLQSEDRPHRAGMDDNPVSYVDLLSDAPVDEKMVDALRGNKNVADVINRDPIEDWI